jgi:Arc/MetJ-type ribon-helix-helix transcriptional regulator
MATVRLDIKTETALKRLTVRRGQTRSEVIREAITRLAGEEEEPRSAYQRLQAFVGVVDSGGQQLSTETGKRLRELLKERSDARRAG